MAPCAMCSGQTRSAASPPALVLMPTTSAGGRRVSGSGRPAWPLIPPPTRRQYAWKGRGIRWLVAGSCVPRDHTKPVVPTSSPSQNPAAHCCWPGVPRPRHLTGRHTPRTAGEAASRLRGLCAYYVVRACVQVQARLVPSALTALPRRRRPHAGPQAAAAFYLGQFHAAAPPLLHPAPRPPLVGY